MRKINLACGLLATLFVIGIADRASAQRPTHFYPARPQFSSYLLYRQVNTTGIPNYYTYVRPEQQLRDFLIRPQRGPDAQQQVVRDVEQGVGRLLESQLRQRVSTGIGRPAAAARFGDTGHFFPRTTIQPR